MAHLSTLRRIATSVHVHRCPLDLDSSLTLGTTAGAVAGSGGGRRQTDAVHVETNRTKHAAGVEKPLGVVVADHHLCLSSSTSGLAH